MSTTANAARATASTAAICARLGSPRNTFVQGRQSLAVLSGLREAHRGKVDEITNARSAAANGEGHRPACEAPSARRAVTRLLPALAASGLSIAFAIGCGSSGTEHTTVETATIQHSIAASILTQRHVPTDVSCPTKVPSVSGIGFTCVAKLDVGSYPVAVVVKDSKGHVRYGNQAPLVVLDIAKLQRAIERSILEQRKLAATVTCPNHVLQQAGLKFLCKARVGEKSYPFAVEQTDASGHVRYIGR